jgi:aspartyl/asparaginyl beta-hydroxylase (cupin superfamily)
MTWLFIVTGGLVWAWILLAIAVRVLKSGPVQRLTSNKRLLPYSMFARYRSLGALGGVLVKLRLPSAVRDREIIDAHKAITLADMEQLRDIYVEMDALPTIQTGKKALGLGSMFELSNRAIHKIPSAYTHPMQYPPYMIPGVPARPFYEANEFEWAQVLEREYPVIKKELVRILGESGAGFKGYMSEANLRHHGWNTFNFFFGGKKFEENCERCPETTRILESLPRFEKDHIMFSSLNPHAKIPRHTGPMNGILRGHLGMVVPQGCYIRVGPEERTWEEGKMLVFDDSFEHEVWNHSEFVRIVLFMNFWHPCFADREIPVLERFRAAYEQTPLSRVHKQNQDAKRAHDMEVARVAEKIQAA